MTPTLEDRIHGVVFGQAVGDALGFGTEFISREEVHTLYPTGLRHYSQITRFPTSEQWQPGDWTDDTDQMLCILDSLLDKGAFDSLDIARRIHHWAMTDGYGMGQTVYAAIHDPQFLTDPQAVARDYWEKSGRHAAANGAVMRTAVLGVWDFHDAERVRHNAEQACLITHADPRCVGSCVAVCEAIRLLLAGHSNPEEVTLAAGQLVSHLHPEFDSYFALTSQPTLDVFDLDEGMHGSREGNRIGYTLKALGAAFWALRHASAFEDGLLAVIHEGGDADTNAAVAGALLGARFGLSGIPAEWRDGLVHGAELATRAERLVGAQVRFNNG